MNPEDEPLLEGHVERNAPHWIQAKIESAITKLHNE